MIKLVYVITRRADLSAEQFTAHWLHAHGPLVAAQAGPLRLRKYVQSHLAEDPANAAMRAARGMLAPVDGVTEVWWDSFADMQAAYATEAGAASGRILSQDEARFIDFSRSQVFLTEEHTIFDHGAAEGPDPEARKILYLGARREGLTPAECRRTWLEDHGPLVAGFAGALGLSRYVQSHAVEPDWNAAIPSAGYAEPVDGVSEIWLDPSGGAASDPAAREAAAAALLADERRFIDMSRSRCFLTREHVIFDHTGG